MGEIKIFMNSKAFFARRAFTALTVVVLSNISLTEVPAQTIANDILIEAEAFEKSLINALRKGDRAALEKMLAAEFFTMLSDRRTFDRKWTIYFWTKPDEKISDESFEIADARAVVSGDTAIVTAIVTDRWRENGVEKTHRERVFDVWQRHKGKWRLLASKPNRIDGLNEK